MYTYDDLAMRYGDEWLSWLHWRAVSTCFNISIKHVVSISGIIVEPIPNPWDGAGAQHVSDCSK